MQHYHKTFEICHFDIQKTWKVLKNLMGQDQSKSRTIAALNIDGCRITNEIEIAEHFNRYYPNVTTDLDTIIRPGNIDLLEYSFFLFPVCSKECLNIINTKEYKI